MSRPRKWPPEPYVRDGVERIKVTVAKGRRVEFPLGPPGSAEARAEYARVLAELEQGARPVRGPGTLVLEIVVAFQEHEGRGKDARTAGRAKAALKPVARLYGHVPAAEFGPVALSVCVAELVKAGYARKYCNTLRKTVVRMFRWAASQELCGVEVSQRLATVPPERRGDSQAPETEPVRPVSIDVVRQTLPHLTPCLADMVRVQLLTGCRPGEACALRPCDLDRNWRVIGGEQWWLYRLDAHKGDWRGHHRWIPVSPAAQQVLLPYLDRPSESYCFTPVESVAQYQARRRGERKSKVQPSQVSRAKPRRSRQLGTRWTTGGYGHAIRSTCTRVGLPHWTPNQLRHWVSTWVETELSRADAQAVLGHRHPSTTAIYSEQVERAAEAMRKALNHVEL